MRNPVIFHDFGSDAMADMKLSAKVANALTVAEHQVGCRVWSCGEYLVGDRAFLP